MKIITNDDQDWLKCALNTTKDVRIKGKWLIPESGVPPYPILRLIAFDDYPQITDDRTVSITTLNVPLKVSWYLRKMQDEMVTDIGQGMAAMLGTALHLIAEKANNYYGQGMAEKILSAPVGEYTLRGIVDHIEDGLNCDYKTGTMAVLIPFMDVNKSEDKPEYIKQVQMQMWLARQNGIQADRSYIASIGRDYSGAMKFKNGIDCYWPPNWQRHIYNYDHNIEKWIHDRVHAFFNVMQIENEDELPQCTNEEMWMRDESFGVYKFTNGKQGPRVVNGGRFYTKFDSNAANQAQQKANELGASNHKVIHQKGTCTRCESWCPARFVCKQKAKMDAQDLS